MNEYNLVEEMMAQAERADKEPRSSSSRPPQVQADIEWSTEDEKRDEDLFALKDLFIALGNHQRLEIIALLQEQAKTPSELAYMLELSRSTITHHVAVLGKAGIVTIKQVGRRRELTVTDELTELLQAAARVTRRP